MGASASADTGWFGVTTQSDSAKATWTFGTPTAAATITWNYGPNKVNATTYARNTPPPVPPTEMKFFTPGVPATAPAVGPAAKVFKGFSRTMGNGGSSVTSRGSGSSALVAGSVVGSNWEASWTVVATGIQLMSSPTGGLPGSYEVTTDADDPMPITRAGLAALGITGGKFSLYLPVGLSQMSHTSQGSGGLSVGFETSTGTVNLLSLRSDGKGVSAKGDNPGYLKIYRIQNFTDNPMALGYAPLRLKDAEHALSTLMNTGNLSSPLRFGILLENIPVPSKQIAKGVVAQFHVSTSVSDAAGGRGDRRRQKGRQGKSD